jgi:hypothetical protein
MNRRGRRRSSSALRMASTGAMPQSGAAAGVGVAIAAMGGITLARVK